MSAVDDQHSGYMPCSICQLPGTGGNYYDPQIRVSSLDCRRCGTCSITDECLREITPEFCPYVSAATRQASDAGRPLPLLMPGTWLEFVEPHVSTSVSGKVETLLMALAKRCKRPGRYVDVTYDLDFPICDAGDAEELKIYLEHLKAKRLIFTHAVTYPSGMSEELGLTIDGWDKVEPRLVRGGTPGRCFVAMWFDPLMHEAYDLGFAPGIRDAGFEPFKIDDKRSNKGITDEIKAEVRMAQFIVADFTAGDTGQRGGVYFEAGFAQGLGREVIWCCRADQMEKVHFDVKHFGHVVWDHPADLRVKLAQSIRANIISKG